MDTHTMKYSQEKKDKKSEWSKLSAAEVALFSGYEGEDENFQTETSIQRADSSKGMASNARFYLSKAFHIGHNEIGFSINGTRFTGHTGWQVRGGTIPLGKGLAIDMSPTELVGDEYGQSAHIKNSSPEPQLVYFGKTNELQEIKLNVVKGEVGALSSEKLSLRSVRPVSINLATEYWANTSKLRITQEGLRLEDVELDMPDKGNGSRMNVGDMTIGQDGIKMTAGTLNQLKEDLDLEKETSAPQDAPVEGFDEYLYGTEEKPLDTSEIKDGMGVVSKSKNTTFAENKKSSEKGGPNDPDVLKTQQKKKLDYSEYSQFEKDTNITVTGVIDEKNPETSNLFAGLPAELIQCMKDGVVPKEKNRDKLTEAANGKVADGAPQLSVEERLRKYQELFDVYGESQRLVNNGKKRDVSKTDVDSGDPDKEKPLFSDEKSDSKLSKIKSFIKDIKEFKQIKKLGTFSVKKASGKLTDIVCDKINSIANGYYAADTAATIATTAVKDTVGRLMASAFEDKGFVDSYRESIHKGLIDEENEQIDRYNNSFVSYNISPFDFDIPILPPWMSARLGIGAEYNVGNNSNFNVSLPNSFGSSVKNIAMEGLGKILEKPASSDTEADNSKDLSSAVRSFVENKLKALGLNVHANTALCGKFGVNAGIDIVLGMKTFFAVSGGASAELAVHGSGANNAFASVGVDKEFKFNDLPTLNFKKIISSGRTDLNLNAGLAVDGGVKAAFKLISKIIGLNTDLWSKNFISFSPFKLNFATTLRSDDGDFLSFKTLKQDFSAKLFEGMKNNEKGPYGLTFNKEDSELTNALATAKSGIEEFDKELALKYGEVKLDDLNEEKLKEITDFLIENSVLFKLQHDEIRELIDRKERDEAYQTGIIELEEKVNKHNTRINRLGKRNEDEVGEFIGSGITKRAKLASEERAIENLATRESLLQYEKERLRMISESKSPAQQMIFDYITQNVGKENVPNPEFTKEYLKASNVLRFKVGDKQFEPSVGARIGSANILNSSSLFVDKEDLIDMERTYLEKAVKSYSDDLGLLLTIAQEKGITEERFNKPNKAVTDEFFKKAQTGGEYKRNPVEQRADVDDLIAYEEKEVNKWIGKTELIEAFKELSDLMDQFDKTENPDERTQIDKNAQDYIVAHSAELGFGINDIIMGTKAGSNAGSEKEMNKIIRAANGNVLKNNLTGYSADLVKSKGEIDYYSRITSKKYGTLGKIFKKDADPFKDFIKKNVSLQTIVDFEYKSGIYYSMPESRNETKAIQSNLRYSYLSALNEKIMKLKDADKREKLLKLVKDKYFSGEIDKEILAENDSLIFALGEGGKVVPNTDMIEKIYQGNLYDIDLHRAMLREDKVSGDIDESEERASTTNESTEENESVNIEKERLSKLPDGWVSTDKIYKYVEDAYLSAPMKNKIRSGLNWVGNKIKWVGYKVMDFATNFIDEKLDSVGGAVSGALESTGQFGQEVGNDVSGAIKQFAPEKKNSDTDRLIKEGHLGRLKRLLEVKRILPTLENDEERHKLVVNTYKNELRAGWGFSTDKLFSRKGIEDTPEKIRAFLLRRIDEEGTEGEKKIAMLKSAKTPEDIEEYRNSLRDVPASGIKRVGRKIVNVARWAFKDSATYADINMKQKAMEKLTPKQILNYEFGVMANATQKHRERILMLEKSVGKPDKEVYKKYVEMGGGAGFKSAYSSTISRDTNEQYEKSYRNGAFTKGQILSYEKSRVEYYKKKLDERKQPISELKEKLKQIKEKMDLIRELESRSAG